LNLVNKVKYSDFRQHTAGRCSIFLTYPSNEVGTRRFSPSTNRIASRWWADSISPAKMRD
jgi:hypothetical protein